jgi:predicted 2-oxoglutarate/Fe(II)-dependent dioxygenase YbiX
MYIGLLDLSHKLVWTLDNVLSLDECATLIREFEARNPVLATVNTGRRPEGEYRTEVRNNSRVIHDDPALAQKLFERVRPGLPEQLSGLHLKGANERFRFYRYEPGQYFKPHYDGAFRRSPSESSLLTFMIYLNGDFDGGETNFLDLGHSIKPRAGLAILFQHHVLHESATLLRGRKYALRSDIMYERRD